MHVRNTDLVIVRDLLLDILNRDFVLAVNQVMKRGPGLINRDIDAVEAGMSDHLLQRAFQLTHVALQVVRDEEGDILRQIGSALFSLLHQNSFSGFELRRIDRHRHAARETALQPFIHILQLLRVGIACEHDLFAVGYQRLEGGEEG